MDLVPTEYSAAAKSSHYKNCPLYNRTVVKPHLLLILWMAVAAGAQTQQPEGQPQVKVNVLNVCTPSTDEQAALKSALVKVSGTPSLAADFEISRGSATLKDGPSKYVRVRRDFSSQSPMMTAQYSVSLDEKVTIETLVLRMRDPKEFLEISFEDRVSATAATPVSVVATDTPAARIRIERLGKSSVVLARCEGADQSVYEPLFHQGSELMARYRGVLGLRTAFRPDVAWLGSKPEAQPHRQRQHKQP